MNINITDAPYEPEELGALLIVQSFKDKKKRGRVCSYFEQVVKELMHRQVIVMAGGKPVICKTAEDMLNRALPKKRNYISLAQQMYELFPRGTKPGTAYSWRYPVVSIAKRLEKLVTETKQTFTDEEAVQATRNYVNSFGSDQSYMRLLKYFICKEKDKGEPESDLLMWIDKLRGGEEQTVMETQSSRDLL